MDNTTTGVQKKVLIVEDDSDISFIYQKSFQDAGYNAEVANTGEDGLQKAKDFQPNVVLLDIMLPGMSGLEVLDKLKDNPSTQNIPVIILSNLNDDKTIESGFSKKADGYILKASEVPEQVMSEVEEILKQNARH